MSACRTALLTAVLALVPLVTGRGRLLLAAAVPLVTVAAWQARDRAALRLGAFMSVFVASLLLGSPYSQVSFGAAIPAYLVVAWRLPRGRGEVAWLAWGHLKPGVVALCVAVVAGAAGGLVMWHSIARPDLGDLVARFVPPVRGALLLVGGLLFALLNAALEEIAYRGVVLDALRESGTAVAAAVGWQAVAFGTLHLNGFPRGWVGVGLAALYGIVLGIIRVRAGGMPAPWIAHVLTDLVIVGILLMVR